MALLKFMCVAYLILFSKGDQCKDNQHCSDCDRTGRCLTDCEPGYFDQTCSSVCSKNCKNRSCQLSGSGSGACTEGCVPGYQGPGCNVRCDKPGGTCATCPGGCDGGYCQLGSSCVSECVDSYYGTGCKTCSSRCKSCNRMTGLCKECRPEYFGLNCAYSCDHCLGSCEHGCAEGCLPGLHGTFCDEKCSEKCGPDPNKLLLSSKADLHVCHRTSGDCIHGCREGWHGQQCSSPCSPNCAKKRCTSTGDCVDGCVPGHFGRDCKPCPVNCLHNMCHSDSGKCTDGCTRGVYGGLCQHTCGMCVDGVCDQDCKQGDRDSGIVDLKIGLSTAFSLFVVIILLALSLFYCKHLRTIRQHNVQGIIPHDAPRHDDQVLPDYCDILDEDVDIMCELPEMNQKESVQGTAPSMPVLAECFAPACDSADNDIATSSRSAVDDNTYSHLTPPVAVEGPKIVVNYVSPIED